MSGFTEDVAGVFAPFMPGETHDALRLDLEDLGDEETYRQLREAEKMLQGLMQAATDVNTCLYVALGAAHTLVQEARDAVQGREVWRAASTRGDALNAAYTTVEDASDDEFRSDAQRQHILTVLRKERDGAWAEAHRIKDRFDILSK